ncbi:MAG TPA: hypothetical protein VED01_13795 [Burkholderiales bacterium]|nr:hypothetical protein [Burkholderiales bacterium]
MTQSIVPHTKDDSGVPDKLRKLIGACIPDVYALELLLVLVQHPHEAYAPAELATRIRNIGLPESALRKHLAQCVACGVVAESNDRFRYDPTRRDTRECMRELVRMYDERPVTLLRAIYAQPQERIRAFSEAFRIAKD